MTESQRKKSIQACKLVKEIFPDICGQQKKLIQACKLVKEIFPDMCGNVKFNLHPEREKVNCNVEYSVIIQPDEYFEPNK